MFNDSFEVGDIVSPLKTIRFMDGLTHNIGEEYTITPWNVDYYNVMGSDYRLIKSVRENSEPTAS